MALFCVFGAVGAKTKSKAKAPSAEEVLEKGREAFLNYEFDEASDLFDQYRTLKNKAKQEVGEEFEELELQLEVASGAFERVQKIVVIDSLSLPANIFYRNYKLSESAGRIGKPGELGVDDVNVSNELSYLSEKGDYFVGVAPDREGNLRLWESQLLLDGSRETRESLAGNFDKSGDYAYPFMSSDGQTLYFANDGADSMGGYDLFVAQKDPISGEFLQPLNLGMPFNSPYDDFMLAIDEENGIGWWATDRNSPDGNVTVYVYLIDDVRKNYPSDTDNLEEFARLSDYRATWEPGQSGKYKEKVKALSDMKVKGEEKGKDFEFPLGNGKVYTSLGDFRNRKASDMMKQYLVKEGELEKKRATLAQMRRDYKTNKSLASKIMPLEVEVEELQANLKATKSEILRLEKSK